MNLSAAALRLMAAKGLTLEDVAEIVAANERVDPTNAQRQARYRERRKDRKDNGVTVTPVTPPNEEDNLTPVSSEPSGSSLKPWARPIGVDQQVWTDLLANRRRKRLPNTETAWRKFQADLANVSAQTGIPPPKLIEMCTAKGWGAIYDPSERSQRHERPDNPTAIAVQRITGALGARC